MLYEGSELRIISEPDPDIALIFVARSRISILLIVADVDYLAVEAVRQEKFKQTNDLICDIAEASGSRPLSINSDGFVVQCLINKLYQCSSIQSRVHNINTRAVGVEYSGNPDWNKSFVCIAICFSNSF